MHMLQRPLKLYNAALHCLPLKADILYLGRLASCVVLPHVSGEMGSSKPQHKACCLAKKATTETFPDSRLLWMPLVCIPCLQNFRSCRGLGDIDRKNQRERVSQA